MNCHVFGNKFSMMAMAILVVSVVAGCGSGGNGGGSPRSGVNAPPAVSQIAPAVSAASTGSFNILVQGRNNSGLAQAATSFTLHFLNPDGTDVVDPRVANRFALLSQGVAVTGVPPGTYLMLVVATDDAGNAVDYGDATVTSSAGSLNAVTVTMGVTIASVVAVSPDGATLNPGDTQQYAATATFSDGLQQTVTPLTVWTTDRSDVATIDASGLATAIAGGSTNVQANFNGALGTSVLNVIPPPNASPSPDASPSPAPSGAGAR